MNTLANQSTASAATARRSPGGCLLRLLAGLLILGGLLYGIQSYLTPPDDPNLTGPETSTADGEHEESGIPKTSITYGITQAEIDAADHPLIPLLKIARDGLDSMNRNVRGYTASITSKVRTGDGTMHPEKHSICKVRHADQTSGLSVYTKFLNPGSIAGQEAIWVDGRNENKLIGHGTGLLNIKRMYLKPDGLLPMKGNRHPISKFGIKNLLHSLIEQGEADLAHREIKVTIERGQVIDGIVCTLLQIEHPQQRDHFTFHIARIYIDDARNLPVAYEGFLWPERNGGPPVFLEKYFYTDIQLNPGLTDADFDPDNDEYNYPRW